VCEAKRCILLRQQEAPIGLRKNGSGAQLPSPSSKARGGGRCVRAPVWCASSGIPRNARSHVGSCAHSASNSAKVTIRRTGARRGCSHEASVLKRGGLAQAPIPARAFNAAERVF